MRKGRAPTQIKFIACVVKARVVRIIVFNQPVLLLSGICYLALRGAAAVMAVAAAGTPQTGCSRSMTLSAGKGRKVHHVL